MKKLVRRRKRNIIGAFLSGIGFIGFGLIVLLMSGRVGVDVETQNAEDISYLSMEKDNVYWIEELTVVDRYAFLEDSNVNYLIVSYEDMRGNIVLASLSMNSSEDYWTSTKNYIEDDNARVGDCVIKGYFELREDVSDNAVERAKYFGEGVAKYKQSGAIPQNAVSLRNVFRYKCSSYDELLALSKGTEGVAKFMGVFALALGALAIYAGFKWISINKKLDAQEAAAKAQNAPTLDDIVNNSGFFTQPTVRRVSTTAPTPPATSTPSATPVAPSTSDKIEKLNEYKAMMDAGYMTPAEFEQKRRELLGL